MASIHFTITGYKNETCANIGSCKRNPNFKVCGECFVQPPKNLLNRMTHIIKELEEEAQKCA